MLSVKLLLALTFVSKSQIVLDISVVKAKENFLVFQVGKIKLRVLLALGKIKRMTQNENCT